MNKEQVYSTPENYTEAGERCLHINNTRDRGRSIDFWMYNPRVKEAKNVIVCGICKDVIPDGYKSCPHCYPER